MKVKKVLMKALVRALGRWLRRRGSMLRRLAAALAPALVLFADVDAVFDAAALAGEYRWEWTAEWSVQTMAEIIAEKIRRAPRPNGWCPFFLEIGCTRSEALLEGSAADPGTTEVVREFLASHVSSEHSMIVYLYLLAETYLAALRRGGWVRESKGLRAALD